MLQPDGIRGCLVDLDGTVFFEGAMIPGADEAIRRLRDMGMKLRFLTNIDSRPNGVICRQLREMGLDIGENEIFSASGTAREFLDQRGKPNSYCLVSRELEDSFAPYMQGEDSVKYVVVGDFRDKVSYPIINTAFRHLMSGAELIALQKGKYFITGDGVYLDTGGFVQLLEYCSGKEALVMGKPSESFFRLAMDQIACTPQDILVVGDDVSTDIKGAQVVGAASVLVKTGKYSDQSLDGSDSKPDFVLKSFADLPSLLGH